MYFYNKKKNLYILVATCWAPPLTVMFIDYQSIEEFDELHEILMHEYEALATEIAHQTSTYNTVPFHEDAPMQCVFEKGLSLWLSFTKNQQHKFCEIQSNTIAFAFFCVIKNYRAFCLGEEDLTEKHMSIIEKMLLNTVDSYFGNEQAIAGVVSTNSYLNIGHEIFQDSFKLSDGKWVPMSQWKRLDS